MTIDARVIMNLPSTLPDSTGVDVVELGQPLSIGVPHAAVQPPFMYTLTSKHGEVPAVASPIGAISGASDAFSMGVHVGTHIDSLTHCSLDGRLFDGTDALSPGAQDFAHGIRATRAEAIRPILARGVLLDFPELLGVERVPSDYAITPAEIERAEAAQQVQICNGDVVLLRTGWDALWHDPSLYLELPLPGPTADTARLLADRQVIATGSDTMPYEQAPGEHPLEVHAELLVRSGIFIMESLNLVELAARRAYSFQFIALPLRIAGATGSPINPVAIVPTRS